KANVTREATGGLRDSLPSNTKRNGGNRETKNTNSVSIYKDLFGLGFPLNMGMKKGGQADLGMTWSQSILILWPRICLLGRPVFRGSLLFGAGGMWHNFLGFTMMLRRTGISLLKDQFLALLIPPLPRQQIHVRVLK
ncbi:hypothetical protein CFOL_v3_21748, partial [Cephalotus follicularis]